MSDSIYAHIRPQIEKIFLRTLGWKISLDNRYSDKKMERVCKKIGFFDIDECISFLSQNRCSDQTIQILAHEFSIGESYFFRDKNFFNTLENKIIPQLLKSKNQYDKNINIWSAGCSGGEEAYSVAMMLNKNIPDIDKWNLYILGTDVNIGLLEKAKRGIYTKNSFREMPEYFENQYFKEADKNYEISPFLKKTVHFYYHNIAQKTPPLPMANMRFDLIVLKNILIYFDSAKAKEVVDFLYSNLKQGGFLCTTAAEYASEVFDSYRTRNFFTESIIQKPQPLTSYPKPLFSDEQLDECLKIEIVDEPIKLSSKRENVNDEKFEYYLKASELLDSGEVKEAKKYLKKSLYIDCNFIVGLISFGNILRKEGKIEESLRYIKRAKELLGRMDSAKIVDFSDGMTAGELLSNISHNKI